jgi:hypothetical protein
MLPYTAEEGVFIEKMFLSSESTVRAQRKNKNKGLFIRSAESRN